MTYFTENDPQTATLQIKGPCNYLCWYCVGEKKTMAHPVPVMHDLQKLMQIYVSLQRRGAVGTTMYANGTEPALHPQIQQIVELCTAFGSIEILTNLSIPVSEWLPGPANCFLQATIHPEAEQDIDGFLDRVQEAQDLGYTLRIQFDSTRIEATDYRERLAILGIKLKPLKLRMPGSEFQRPDSIPCPAEALCMSGYDTVFITSTTVLCRCNRNIVPLHKPLSAPTSCTHSATCPVRRAPK